MTIIHSILDNDLYKFTMQQAVNTLYPWAETKYEFINRGAHGFPEGFAEALQAEVDLMEYLGLTHEERQFLEVRCPYFSPMYLDFLEGYKFNPKAVSIIQKGAWLDVHVQGVWGREILWEVPLMSIISELYFKMTGQKGHFDDLPDVEKAHDFGDLLVADFGTRRRYSRANHNRIIKIFKRECEGFMGTSNVYLAMKHNLQPIGTQAHEWFQAHGAMFGYNMANQSAMDAWLDSYNGALGIALSDTYTTDVFYKNFDMGFSKVFDGIRQDSGDPIEFIDKTLEHYDSVGIDPSSKILVFSDGLNIAKVLDIEEYVAHLSDIKTAYGIGTNLTNDVGVEPMNMVIKMVGFKEHNGDWKDVIKLSDSVGKHTGNPDEIELCKKTLGLK